MTDTLIQDPQQPVWRGRVGFVLAFVSGALLGLPVHFPILAPLQLPALATFWWLIISLRISGRPVWKIATIMGAGYGVVRLAGVMLPVPVLLILLLGGVLFWSLTGMILGRFYRATPMSGALAAGGWLVLAEWGLQHLMPLFGTGQSFAVCWSPWGHWLPFVPLLGMPSVTFLLGSISWLVAGLFQPRQSESLNRWKLAASAGLLLMIPLAGGFVWRASGERTIIRKIAVWGCPVDVLNHGNIASRLLVPAMTEAAQKGAGLIVFPEMILQDGNPAGSLAKLRAEAARLKIAVVLGWYEGGKNSCNCLTIIGSDGNDLATYAKTHLVPLMEDYDVVGNGTPGSADWNGVRLAAMICQDDNFPSMGWAAALQGANLLTVPTFDWPGVHHIHFLNSRWRPLENGMALAKAAIGGFSALVDSDGRVVASADCTKQPALVLADLPIPSSPSPYHRWGDWPMLGLSAVFILTALARQRRNVTADPQS